MNRLFVFVIAAIIAVSLAYTPVASADAGAGEKVFKSKAGKCKPCHKLSDKYTVGPGLKGVGAKYSKEFLLKWLSSENAALFEAGGPDIDKVKATYKAKKKKDLTAKKSQMIKNFNAKKPKIKITDQQRADVVDYLMTL